MNHRSMYLAVMLLAIASLVSAPRADAQSTADRSLVPPGSPALMQRSD